MALRIEKAFGIKMDTLMRMQASYDIARARMRAGDIRVERYRTAAACSVTPQALSEGDGRWYALKSPTRSVVSL